MPQLTLPAAALGLPLTRRDIERHVDALIDLLDTLDADPDLEPSLGWTSSMGHYLETPTDLIANANAGDDRESDDSDYEPDTDSEPSLGWRGAGCFPESDNQAGVDFHLNADHGGELEEDHDGREPDVDGEPSLGWTTHDDQSSAAFHANHLGMVDMEDGVGAVRKARPASKTGGKVLRGCAVLL